MKLSETIASNIKRLRLAQKITQEEAAFRCDISTRHYSDIENSKTNLSVDVLDKLSYGLGVPPAELVGLHSTKHTLIFSLFESKTVIEDNEVQTFGIQINVDNDGENVKVMTCEDISTDKNKVLQLSSVLNRLQPSIGHIGDVVDDFLVELEL